MNKLNRWNKLIDAANDLLKPTEHCFENFSVSITLPSEVLRNGTVLVDMTVPKLVVSEELLRPFTELMANSDNISFACIDCDDGTWEEDGVEYGTKHILRIAFSIENVLG